MVSTAPELPRGKQPIHVDEHSELKSQLDVNNDGDSSATTKSISAKEQVDNDIALTDSDDGINSNSLIKHEDSYDSSDNSSLHHVKTETQVTDNDREMKITCPLESGDQLERDMISLIKQHRLLRLVEGEKFSKYSNKGQRIKDKYWFCRLSNNHKTLHFGDCRDNDMNPKIDELDNKLSLGDVKRLVLGKDCPHMKDNKSKRSTVNLAFSLVYENGQEGILNFVAPHEKSYSYWIDGLCVLMNQDMLSEEFHKDLKMLSQIEIKMRSLNIEEMEIVR